MFDENYEVVFYAYCGMSHTVCRTDKESAKETARQMIRRAKKRGQTVNNLGDGEYEFETPEDARIVSDREGTLKIRRVRRKARR
jgi:hypothetical protein